MRQLDDVLDSASPLVVSVRLVYDQNILGHSESIKCHPKRPDDACIVKWDETVSGLFSSFSYVTRSPLLSSPLLSSHPLSSHLLSSLLISSSLIFSLPLILSSLISFPFPLPFLPPPPTLLPPPTKLPSPPTFVQIHIF